MHIKNNPRGLKKKKRSYIVPFYFHFLLSHWLSKLGSHPVLPSSRFEERNDGSYNRTRDDACKINRLCVLAATYNTGMCTS
jgi:hypothetical protein